MSIDNIFTILPGTEKDASDFGSIFAFAEVFCDSPIVSFAGRTYGNTAGITQDRAGAGVYEATDAKCLIATTGSVYEPFDKIYVATTSDPVRVKVLPISYID